MTKAGFSRTREALNHALGDFIATALADALVVEVMANPDGKN